MDRRNCMNCGKRFLPVKGIQKFCSGKCRRRVEHLRYVTKYPEERKKRMDKLLQWKKEHPLAKRVKRRFFKPAGLPAWLTGR